jgi:hypothetical protein
VTIRAIVFDVSGTLLNKHNRPVDGVLEMLQEIAGAGFQLIAAMNETRAHTSNALRIGGIDHFFDHVVTRTDTGVPKGSPVWVQKFTEATAFSANEIAYLGDSDRDMITATRGPMLYFHAAWSVADPNKYGFRAESPKWFSDVSLRILLKGTPWYWRTTDNSSWPQPIEIRALLAAGDLLDDPLKSDLLQLLKHDRDVLSSAEMSIRDFVSLHLLASIFHDDLFSMDLWTCIPGHAGARNLTLEPTLQLAANLSRTKFRPDLIQRTHEAERSNVAYWRGGTTEAMKVQLSSLAVNPKYRLAGKRVLVLDNYLTHGTTTEAVRMLLYMAGAAEVVSVAVGKYPSNPCSWKKDMSQVSLSEVGMFTPPRYNYAVHVPNGSISNEAMAQVLNGYLAYRSDDD